MGPAVKPWVKFAIVVGGYLLALLMACAAVALHVAITSVTDPQSSGGMYAFGDMVLFVVVFGAVTLVPTGAAVFFLWPRKRMPSQRVQPGQPEKGLEFKI
jgi:hypothetical protein